MVSNNLLLTLASVAAIISLLSASFVYVYTDNFKKTWVTGFATDTAYVNITISAVTAINFTADTRNFGTGAVNTGASNATLSTTGIGSVTLGTWAAISGGLNLENIGNTNVTLDLTVDNNSTQLIGGNSPHFMYNVTNNVTNGLAAGDGLGLLGCINSSASTTIGAQPNQTFAGLSNWSEFNSTTPGARICNIFRSDSQYDEIKIDILLVVPQDSITGQRNATITATATAIS